MLNVGSVSPFFGEWLFLGEVGILGGLIPKNHGISLPRLPHGSTMRPVDFHNEPLGG